MLRSGAARSEAGSSVSVPEAGPSDSEAGSRTAAAEADVELAADTGEPSHTCITEGVYKAVLQKPTPPQIRELILHH